MAGTGHGQRTGNLPAESTSFVGRRSELRGVESLLETSRLVTLTGVGGVGKSRLALRAADRMRRAFPHGVWVVPLAPLREPTLLGIAVLEELCLADRTTRSAEEVVAEWLADKELLLVLDSCEHLVGACARMAETFLAAAPGLRILATSRQPLGVAEERRFEVDPLPIVNPERDARPDTKAGHGPDVETGPWPNTKASPGPDTETGPRPNVETGPGPNVKTDPGPDVKTGPRPDTKAGPGPDTETDPRPNTETGPGPDTKASPEPDTKTDPRPNVETGPGPNVKTDPGPDVKTGPRPDTKAGPRPDTKAGPGPNVKTNPGPDPRPGPECAPGPVAVHGCSDALALFVDRAAAAAPGLDLGLELDDVARAAAEALCRRLDGIPLAIELAAAQLSDCSLDALSERLHSRFEVLTARHHAVSGALARHSTLRTTIGWSHELCTPLERLLWARLSVFAGGFDLNAAESVCSGGPLPARTVPETLDGLVAKSLVRPRADGPGPVLRYGMLDTVREYGTHWLRELGEDEADAARRRHRDFYRELARRADAEWFGPHQVSWYERTVADHANLRCALDFCLTDADGRSALEMGGALWFFWCGCGFAREGRHYLEQALDRFPAPGPHRARAVWACGLSALAQGDADAAARLGRNFRTAAESRSDPAALTVAAYLDGASLMQLGKNRDAAVVLDAAPYTQDHGSTYTAVRFLSGVVRAFVHANLGEFDDAAVVAAGLRTESVRRGERWGRAWADWILALSAFGLGRPDEAASFARTALEGKALFHDSLGSAVAVDLLASAAVATGRSERAARLLGIGQRIWETLGLSQLGMPELVAAREATERQARQDIGDTAYETAYGAGLESDIDEGIAYGLRPCT